MTAVAVTSITNFILAGEVLFLAGRTASVPKDRFSAAWFWAGVMLLLGMGAMIGGIDHGFFEASNQPRYGIQRFNWIVLGAMTFCLLMATSRQFFPPGFQCAVLVVGIIQFVADTALVLLVDSFLDVILDYAPVMILLLAMNFAGLKSRRGSWAMVAGILILFAASGVQASGMDRFSPLDHNGLYHAICMIGTLLLYLGGRQLRTKSLEP